MKKLTGTLLGFSLLFGISAAAVAQEKSAAPAGPPKVLVITREFVKPGKAGPPHDKAESAFVQAMARAKWPQHYLAVTSLSGKSRALFLTPYASFDAWEKDTQATDKNAALSAALSRAAVADGELLDSLDQGVFLYSEEFSHNPMTDLPQMRYLESSVFHVRPGHRKEWGELVKLYKTIVEKADPDAHWATYECIYGAPSGTYVIFSLLKSAAEIDKGFEKGKSFMAASGEENLKKLNELEVAAIASSETNLFVFSPQMSYVGEDWIKADPDFWKPKPASAPAAKGPGKKPAAKP